MTLVSNKLETHGTRLWRIIGGCFCLGRAKIQPWWWWQPLVLHQRTLNSSEDEFPSWLWMSCLHLSLHHQEVSKKMEDSYLQVVVLCHYRIQNGLLFRFGMAVYFCIVRVSCWKQTHFSKFITMMNWWTTE